MHQTPNQKSKKEIRTHPLINLKHRLRHHRLHHLLHFQPTFPCQVEKRQVLVQQPRPMRAEEDQSSRGRGTPECGLDGLEELGVLGMVKYQVGEDEGVEASWGLGALVGEQMRGRCAPEVAFDAHRGFWRRQKRLGGRNVGLEIIQELLVRVIRQDDASRAQHGSHETRQARAGTELQDIFSPG